MRMSLELRCLILSDLEVYGGGGEIDASRKCYPDLVHHWENFGGVDRTLLMAGMFLPHSDLVCSFSSQRSLCATWTIRSWARRESVSLRLRRRKTKKQWRKHKSTWSRPNNIVSPDICGSGEVLVDDVQEHRPKNIAWTGSCQRKGAKWPFLALVLFLAPKRSVGWLATILFVWFNAPVKLFQCMLPQAPVS